MITFGLLMFSNAEKHLMIQILIQVYWLQLYNGSGSVLNTRM